MTKSEIKNVAIEHATEAYNDCDEDFRTVWTTSAGRPSEAWLNAMGGDAVEEELGVERESREWGKALKVYDDAYIAQWDQLCEA